MKYTPRDESLSHAYRHVCLVHSSGDEKGKDDKPKDDRGKVFHQYSWGGRLVQHSSVSLLNHVAFKGLVTTRLVEVELLEIIASGPEGQRMPIAGDKV